VDAPLTLSAVTAGDALDLGCGPGRHAIPLARRGTRVTDGRPYGPEAERLVAVAGR
jgi:SAM-dependent methyltransferase